MGTPRALISAPQLASGLLDNTAGRITFWTFRETTGTTAAVVRLWDGTAINSTLLVTISLTAGQSTRDEFGLHWLPYRTGLYLEMNSGACEGQVYSVPESNLHEYAPPVIVVGTVEVDVLNQP